MDKVRDVGVRGGSWFRERVERNDRVKDEFGVEAIGFRMRYVEWDKRKG